MSSLRRAFRSVELLFVIAINKQTRFPPRRDTRKNGILVFRQRLPRWIQRHVLRSLGAGVQFSISTRAVKCGLGIVETAGGLQSHRSPRISSPWHGFQLM